MKEIAIEPLLYGEYHVAVYEDQELMLDKKYYCTSNFSAKLIAKDLKRKTYKDYEIVEYDIEGKRKTPNWKYQPPPGKQDFSKSMGIYN